MSVDKIAATLAARARLLEARLHLAQARQTLVNVGTGSERIVEELSDAMLDCARINELIAILLARLPRT